MKYLLNLTKHSALLFICICLLHYILSYENQKIKSNNLASQNTILRKSMEGIGAGFPVNDDSYAGDRKRIEWWINNHGLRKYHWKYDIGYPIMSPLDGYIRSEFGYRLNDEWEWHNGIDINSKWDVRIIAAHSGIARVKENELYGKYIEITNSYEDRVITTLYGHLSDCTIDDIFYVDKGDIIGYIGNTGKSKGLHLHFTVFIDGKAVNPVANSTMNKKVEL